MSIYKRNVYILKPCREIVYSFQGSQLHEDKLHKDFKIFRMGGCYALASIIILLNHTEFIELWSSILPRRLLSFFLLFSVIKSHFKGCNTWALFYFIYKIIVIF